MSLAINTNQVSQVLMADGKWRTVATGTFDVDAYEMVEQDEAGNVVYVHNGVNAFCSTGFRFESSGGDLYAGPISAILAVMIDPKLPKSRS